VQERILTRFVALFGALSFFIHPTLADGPGDNRSDKVRPIPPPGKSISESDRQELERGVDELRGKIDQLRESTKKKPALRDLLPDIEIFYNAVHYALKYDEFFNPSSEVPAARELLKAGMERAAELESGSPQWPKATGLTVHGYVSKIDGSVQPYGLIVPPSFTGKSDAPRRLDTWFHGRGETLSELNFLRDRMHNPGEFRPENAFVLHLYGRYCNANKFAGEIDLFEALDDVKERYAVDENRIVVRGFSMGGASCWQFATHYAGLWAAANPGAGFAETAEFLRIFQNEPVAPPWWEQKLWHWYDSTDYALNLFNCPTVAYSGEIDRQKQAADIMAKALGAEGMELTHIIGPKTAHRYEPGAKREVSRRIDSIARKGRNPTPNEVHFETWTLRYNRMLWVIMDGMEEHWEKARIDAQITGPDSAKIKTRNVTAFTLSMEPGHAPFDLLKRPMVEVDGVKLEAPSVLSDRSWTAHFQKTDGKWNAVEKIDFPGLHKSPGLQGPIDDAFMDSFIFVIPSGAAMNEEVGAWVASEQQHAIREWRRQFRGEARVVKDSELTPEQIESANLVLWGDPQSNEVLAKIADKLPIQWSASGFALRGRQYGAKQFVPVMIYPNPLNPKRYVVVNSGFTYREYDYLNNARQVAKLPDYAVVDISVPPNSRYPGKIVDAGFFDEAWKLKAQSN
jgi:pimeloyl-ACP methyl ester carboxylesterase